MSPTSENSFCQTLEELELNPQRIKEACTHCLDA